MTLAACAGAYGVIRFVEAYGLWLNKTWAEWFAIISGSIYLPVEIYELVERVTWTRATVLLVNAFIVSGLRAFVEQSRPHRRQAGSLTASKAASVADVHSGVPVARSYCGHCTRTPCCLTIKSSRTVI